VAYVGSTARRRAPSSQYYVRRKRDQFRGVSASESKLYVFDVAREGFTNIEARAQPIRILVPWKASLRSAGVARIAKSNRAATSTHRWLIGVKF
jgi:ribosomal protein S2